MRKYFLVAKNTWDEILTYRLNFSVWRMRNVFQLITVFFFWRAIVPQGGSSFAGYQQATLLTYILGVTFLNSIVFTSRSASIGDDINRGNLSNFLIQPFNYFLYWAARDAGDKLMNISFAVVEYGIFICIFRPPIFLQTNILLIFSSVIALAIAIVLAFLCNFLLGFIAFWSPEVWAPRFIFTIVISFFSGGFFPLQILPKFWYTLLLLTPFPYMQYVPIQLYLGHTPPIVISEYLVAGSIWIFFLLTIVSAIWRKGLQEYSAEGR